MQEGVWIGSLVSRTCAYAICDTSDVAVSVAQFVGYTREG